MPENPETATDLRRDEHQPGIPRRSLLRAAGLAVGAGVAVDVSGMTRAKAAPAAPPRASRRATKFGIGYETWFVPGVTSVDWTSPEAKPVLGFYRSDDPAVITQHAKWITRSGIDFILVDWSNNLGGNWTNGIADAIIAATDKLFEVYATLAAHPQVTLLLGLDNGQVGTTNFNAQIDLITQHYLNNSTYSRMLVQHDGKPLLSVYTGPTFQPPSAYTSDTFTVRMMGAYMETTLNPTGAWSWLDRVPVVNGPVTLISDFASDGLSGWNADPAWRITTGTTNTTFPDPPPSVSYATMQPASGASQQTGTITSPPFVISEDAITFKAIGTDPIPTLDTTISTGSRNLFFLKDAATGEVLRSAEPSQTTAAFAMRQWSVRELRGRNVVFQAVNASSAAWIGFFGLAQQRNEQIAAAFSNAGQTGFLAPDAYPRNSGGYFMRFMDMVFGYEPEIAIIQQWNEFNAPDQYSPALSNDIEPTVVTKLAGDQSDGWGNYYLNLTTEVIEQYRKGLAVPRAALDTRYP